MTLIQEKFLLEKLVNSFVIDEISISPSGTKVIYTVQTFGHLPGKTVSSLWMAEVDAPNSSRQLTSGQYHDLSPQWSPDGNRIAFLSNRGVGGEKSYLLYALDVSSVEEELVSVRGLLKSSDLRSIYNITKFYWSPDGQSIAFLCPDEKDPGGNREISGDDIEVFGDWRYTRSYLLDLKGRKVSILYDKSVQVEMMAWSPDSSQVLFVVYKTPELDSPYRFGTLFETVSVGTPAAPCEFVSSFPGPIHGGSLVWASENRIFFTSGVMPELVDTSLAVYALLQHAEIWKWSKDSHGDTDCGEDLRTNHGLVFGKVLSGLSDRIHVLSDGKHDEYALYSGEEQISSWDAKSTQSGHVLALAKSNTLCPQELFTTKVAYNKSGSLTTIPLHPHDLNQISNHNKTLSSSVNPQTTSHAINCKSSDKTTDLNALFISPSPSTTARPNPLPTCVFIHGGPYFRVTHAFDSNASYMLWEQAILSLSNPPPVPGSSQPRPHNFAILAPNYRGGSSHGEKFAAYARGGLGIVEYDDIISLVDEGIKLGLIDPKRIIVGGWSQGGILSCLLATRRNLEAKAGEWKIRGAICGAGGTDMDSLAFTSDHPFAEAEFVGGYPWEKERDDSISENASAIRRLRNHEKGGGTVPPILILHGKEDLRLPVGQAVGFQRACQGFGVECEMAVYPRDPHIVRETGHLIDMLDRVSRFCIRHLGY